MDTQIIIAIISGMTAILAAIMPDIIKYYLTGKRTNYDKFLDTSNNQEDIGYKENNSKISLSKLKKQFIYTVFVVLFVFIFIRYTNI